MPLSFPPAPQPFFSRRREMPQNEQANEHIENNNKSAVPVEPLYKSKISAPMIPPQTIPTQTIPPQMIPPQTEQPSQQMQQPLRPMIPPHKIPPMPLMTQMPMQMPSQMPHAPVQKQSAPPLSVPSGFMPSGFMPSGSESVPPERAAEQFRRVNNTLPDGVRYEPLDEETMRILRQNNPNKQEPGAQVQSATQAHSGAQVHSGAQAQSAAQTPQVLPPASQIPQPPPVPKLSPEIAVTLEKLAQDERNAAVFYGHFAENSRNSEIKKIFGTLAKDSEARMEQYIALLAFQFNLNFIPQKTEINTEIGLEAAISLALSEEGKGLSALGDLMEATADTLLEKAVGRLINRKIISHQLLLAIK